MKFTPLLSILAISAPTVSSWRLTVGESQSINFTGFQRRGCTFVDGDAMIGRTYKAYTWDPYSEWTSTLGFMRMNCCVRLFQHRGCPGDMVLADTCKRTMDGTVGDGTERTFFAAFEVRCPSEGVIEDRPIVKPSPSPTVKPRPVVNETVDPSWG